MKVVVQHELMEERCAPKVPLCVDKFLNELTKLSGKNWNFSRSFGEQTDENRDCIQRCCLQISDLVSLLSSMKTFVSSSEAAVESKTLAVSDHAGVVWGKLSYVYEELSDRDLSDIGSVSDSKKQTANSKLQEQEQQAKSRKHYFRLV